MTGNSLNVSTKEDMCKSEANIRERRLCAKDKTCARQEREKEEGREHGNGKGCRKFKKTTRKTKTNRIDGNYQRGLAGTGETGMGLQNEDSKTQNERGNRSSSTRTPLAPAGNLERKN